MSNIALRDGVCEVSYYVIAVRAALANAHMGLSGDEAKAIALVLTETEDKIRVIEEYLAECDERQRETSQAA